MTKIVQLPRLDSRKSEYIVFTHVEKFAELAHKLFRGRKGRFETTPQPVTVLRELGKTIKLPVPEIQELFAAVTEAAFSYKEPEIKPEPWKYEPIFSEKDIMNWSRHRQDLKLAINMHISIMEKLQQTQIDCWRSRAKVQKYALMVVTAQTSIEYHRTPEAEYKARFVALEELKDMFAVRQKRHIKNVKEYKKLLAEEERMRENVIEISTYLRAKITACIRAKIEEGLADLVEASYATEYTVTYDTVGLSERIYDATCKHYKFGFPPNDPANILKFNVAIYSPKLLKSGLNFKDISQTYARIKNIFTSARNSSSQDSAFDDLHLKKGDKVRLDFLGTGGTRGFGWVKHSSLSFKKWGFFQIGDLVPKYSNKESCANEATDD